MSPFFKLFVQAHVWLYSTSGGRVASTMQGRKIILLTTVGNKSGKRRTVPVVPYFEGEDMYVMASLAGAPQNPAWFNNLKAKPEVGVQLGADQWTARAEIVADKGERDRLWKDITQAMPNFGEYQKKTERVIPVVKLARIEGA